MSETTIPSPAATAPAASETTAATSVSATSAAPPRARRADRPVQTVGRRKEAIVRVRLVPRTGKFTLNGRALENYFPSKVHQQLVKEPLVITDKAEALDVHANLRGGGRRRDGGLAHESSFARAHCAICLISNGTGCCAACGCSGPA